jgi:hypothetical protein
MTRVLFGCLALLLVATATGALAQETQSSDNTTSTASLRPSLEATSSLVWLRTPTIRRELGLTNIQVGQIDKLRSEFDAIVQPLCDNYFRLSAEQREKEPLDEQIKTATAPNDASPTRWRIPKTLRDHACVSPGGVTYA